VEDYLTSNLQAYFSEQEELESEGMEACKNARKKHGLVPDPEEDPEETGWCDECPVNLAGNCPLL